MSALVRYEFALLVRSQRWIAPLVLYVVAVVGLGASAGQSTGEALRWSALMPVPVVAWPTGVPLAVAAVLAALVWTASAITAGLFANATVIVQPGAAHFPWLDDPEFFVAEITSFLG